MEDRRLVVMRGLHANIIGEAEAISASKKEEQD